jgi:anti-sigma B factor antagonist
MSFDYKINKHQKIVSIDFNGRLMDRMEAVGINVEIEDLLAEGNQNYVIDLSNLEYMNSTGLNILLNLTNKAKESGGDVVIASVSPRIESLFTVTKLDSVFNIAKNKEEAMVRLEH